MRLIFAIIALLSLAGNALAIGPGPVPQWIWATFLEHDKQPAYFRQVVEVRAGLKKAELHALADDRATVFIDGKEVAKVESASKTVVVDVTAHVTKGKHVLAIKAFNERGPAGVLIDLQVTPEKGLPTSIITDPRWLASEKPDKDWQTAESVDAEKWTGAVSKGLIGCPPWDQAIVDTPDYHQWKKALGAGRPRAQRRSPRCRGFRSSWCGRRSQGRARGQPGARSKGRLLIGREGPGILRYTLPKGGETGTMETIDNTLLECRGLLWAYDSLYAHANNSKGFYRLRDTDGDDQFDDVKLLKATPGGVGHGRNDLTLGPDGKIYLICGNDVKLPEDFELKNSPFRNWADDRLLKCSWDKYLFDRNATLPAGHVIRTDKDGQTWELFAGGFRNPYGLDFSLEGELFTFDADNEGDLGLPWYRPTRVNHIVSGGDYGWRQGSGIRPQWFPDTLPSTLDIGKSSPTSVKFGMRSNFPEPYKQALFILDWSYGRIYAIHLIPRGASYAATAEVFVAGKPLNVTDLEFGPDGSMYFTTGGRGTQSGLYRVSYTSTEPRVAAVAVPMGFDTFTHFDWGAAARQSRIEAEAWHGGKSGSVEIGQLLGSDDSWSRHADRIALESLDVNTWKHLAVGPNEQGGEVGYATRLMALARVGGVDRRARIIAELGGLLPLFPETLPRDATLILLRDVQITLARNGFPEQSLELQSLESTFPSDCRPIDQLGCEILVSADSKHVVSRTIPLLVSASTSYETLTWLFLLRDVKHGWTRELRRTFMQHLQKANAFEGGRDMPTVLTSIRYEFLANVPEAERAALIAEFPARGAAEPEPTVPSKPVVKEYTLNDLAPLFTSDDKGDPKRGAEVYAAARCVRCHRIKGQGIPVGPDLTGAALRFSRRDLLVSLVEPSKSVDEKFRNIAFELHSGKTVSGRVITGDDQRLLVSPNPLEPDLLEIVPTADIAGQQVSNISPMPAGLLNTLTLDEIRDLLAYLDAIATP